LQRAQTLADQNIGIGTTIGGKQLLQFQILLRYQRIELFFRQPLSRTFASSRNRTQIGVQLIVRRLNVNRTLRAQEQHPAVKAEANVFGIVFGELC
jgi:hypothetical protein